MQIYLLCCIVAVLLFCRFVLFVIYKNKLLQVNSIFRVVFSRMEITLRQWIESCLSFKYISNFSSIVCIIAYYTNAYQIFFILAPLMITNLIFTFILEWFDLDELVKGVFAIQNHSQNTQQNTIQNISYIKNQFLILNTFWHIIPVLWLYHILNKEHLINIFKPNFMGMYLEASVISIIYFYFGSKNMVYGDINYSGYLILYFLVLLGVCCYLYFL